MNLSLASLSICSLPRARVETALLSAERAVVKSGAGTARRAPELSFRRYPSAPANIYLFLELLISQHINTSVLCAHEHAARVAARARAIYSQKRLIDRFLVIFPRWGRKEQRVGEGGEGATENEEGLGCA